MIGPALKDNSGDIYSYIHYLPIDWYELRKYREANQQKGHVEVLSCSHEPPASLSMATDGSIAMTPLFGGWNGESRFTRIIFIELSWFFHMFLWFTSYFGVKICKNQNGQGFHWPIPRNMSDVSGYRSLAIVLSHSCDATMRTKQL